MQQDCYNALTLLIEEDDNFQLSYHHSVTRVRRQNNHFISYQDPYAYFWLEEDTIRIEIMQNRPAAGAYISDRYTISLYYPNALDSFLNILHEHLIRIPTAGRYAVYKDRKKINDYLLRRSIIASAHRCNTSNTASTSSCSTILAGINNGQNQI